MCNSQPRRFREITKIPIQIRPLNDVKKVVERLVPLFGASNAEIRDAALRSAVHIVAGGTNAQLRLVLDACLAHSAAAADGANLVEPLLAFMAAAPTPTSTPPPKRRRRRRFGDGGDGLRSVADALRALCGGAAGCSSLSTAAAIVRALTAGTLIDHTDADIVAQTVGALADLTDAAAANNNGGDASVERIRLVCESGVSFVFMSA